MAYVDKPLHILIKCVHLNQHIFTCALPLHKLYPSRGASEVEAGQLRVYRLSLRWIARLAQCEERGYCGIIDVAKRHCWSQGERFLSRHKL